MKTILYSAQSNKPNFCSSSGMLHYQYFVVMVEHWSTASNTLLHSKHVVTDDKLPSSEGASEGDTEEHDGCNADGELPMYDSIGGNIIQTITPWYAHPCV